MNMMNMTTQPVLCGNRPLPPTNQPLPPTNQPVRPLNQPLVPYTLQQHIQLQQYILQQ